MVRKTTMTVVVTLGLVGYAYGQGQVNFDNRVAGTIAYFYDWPPYGYALLAGSNFFAQLYAAAGSVSSSSSLAPVGHPVNFQSGTQAGWVQDSGTTSLGWTVDPIVNVTAVNGGAATVQVRVWWNAVSTITTYEAAIASANPNMRYLASPLLFLWVTGNPNAWPPTVPVDLVGLQGAMWIPEPSTLGLLGLAMVALFLGRRHR